MINWAPEDRGWPVSARVPSGPMIRTLSVTVVTCSLNVSTTWTGGLAITLFWAGLGPTNAAWALAATGGIANRQNRAKTMIVRSRTTGDALVSTEDALFSTEPAGATVRRGVTGQSCRAGGSMPTPRYAGPGWAAARFW